MAAISKDFSELFAGLRLAYGSYRPNEDNGPGKQKGQYRVVSEDIDDEDAAAQQATANTKDSVSVISRKLQDTTKEMKTTVNKWKQAEGEEKERLLARLKDLTKIKKELEGLL